MDAAELPYTYPGWWRDAPIDFATWKDRFPHHIEIADNKVAVALTADTSTAPPWPLDADRFGRSRRIRARTDPDTDRRGARACESEGCNSWSKAKAYRRREAIARREAGEVLMDIARSYNVSHSTISRLR